MKRSVPLLLAVLLLISLCACRGNAPAVPETSPAADSASEEKTVHLLNNPVEFERSDGSVETIYLTSVTLRDDCTVCTFLRDASAEGAEEFPDVYARTESGDEYVLEPAQFTDGAVCFCAADIPVGEITELSFGAVTVELSDITAFSDAETLYKEKLNDLHEMRYSELFAYAMGSDGAYSEGVASELADRMMEDPVEFAYQLLIVGCPHEGSAESFVSSMNGEEDELFSAYGFDAAAEKEICTLICSGCLVTEFNAAVETMQQSDDPYVLEIAQVLTDARRMISDTGGQ